MNQGTAECIEIWNLVFIQFNANPDGTFSPLPARHVDTGMGFERVTGIIQNTRDFTDFSRMISNYETDIFRPIFDKLEKLSGKKYGSTLPAAGSSGRSEQEKVDIAFRVIADHIRTLSFAIADGIQPGNTDRNYVLRRILRRAVRYGRIARLSRAVLLQAGQRAGRQHGARVSGNSAETGARRRGDPAGGRSLQQDAGPGHRAISAGDGVFTRWSR